MEYSELKYFDLAHLQKRIMYVAKVNNILKKESWQCIIQCYIS
jgi:hypothetical protein